MTETTIETPKRKRIKAPDHPAMAAIREEQAVLGRILKAIDGRDPDIAHAALVRALETLRPDDHRLHEEIAQRASNTTEG